jgi:putative ABC transport system permease protein
MQHKMDMNIKIAIRQLSKNRLFTFLNLAGLAVGLTVALLMGLWALDELRFDRWNERADRIFRINTDIRFGGQESALAVAPAPMGPTFEQDFPMVERACRFRQMGFITAKKGEEIIEEGTANTYVDASFFDIFSVKMLEGDPKTALVEPFTMVISEKIARKYFGSPTGVVGKTLRINDIRDQRITGVMADWPAQSHMAYDFLFSMSSLDDAKSPVWVSNNYQTYLLLREGVKKADLEAQFPAVLKKYIEPQIAEFTGASYDDMLAKGDFLRYSLVNLLDIHLKSDRIAEQAANGEERYVWIFGLVALIVLGLACINFMNLSTARASLRAHEVGVRKTLGSSRGPLVWQFLSESLVLTVAAFSLAIFLVKLSLPSFNSFAEKSIEFDIFDWKILAALAALAFLTAGLAGLWPAFFLSKFRPIEAFRAQSAQPKSGAGRLRSGLVVFQFCASIALIISVLTVNQQLQFIQNKKLGYEKERLVQLRNTWYLREKTLDFKAKLLETPGIEAVSATNYFPTPSPRSDNAFNEKGAGMAAGKSGIQWWDVDFDYQKTLGLTVVEGRWLNERLATDSSKCVINRSTAQLFGWSEPIGKYLETFSDPSMTQKKEFEVVGVVEDFHFESLRENIGPLLMTVGNQSGTMAVRFSKNADIEKTMASVGVLFKKYLPSQPFSYRFIDEEFDRQYRAEQRIGGILSGFAGFAIFIACLGLFGLAAFMVERRVKEIGIRKVLGASVAGITGLLAKDFLKLVLVAIVIASPVAYYFMQKWLSDFAYRIDIQWWMFAGAGVLAVAIAFLTVGFQSVRAALADPVKSLRSE